VTTKLLFYQKITKCGLPSFLLPKLIWNETISWKFHTVERPKIAVNCDMIIRLDLLNELGIILDFSKYVIK
jgi:hypothetical protein